MYYKYRGHIIVCHLLDDVVHFAVYPDIEEGEMRHRTRGAFVPPPTQADPVSSYIEQLKAEIDEWCAPNAETLEAMRQAESGEGLIRHESLEAAFKHLGI